MAEQKKLAFEIPVSTRLPEDLVAEVDSWSEREWRDRSKTLGAILRTVLLKVKETGGFEQSLNSVLGRLRLDPS
jgi:metal-responsive CopG/Arc/MetJ family transcriptional regulator